MKKLGLTAIEGILVGHYTDETAKTGCTAIMCKEGAVAGVDVRGSAPGTRETDLLRGYNSVEKIHTLMLCGGSAYGLDAASGAMQYLEEHDIGLDVGVCRVPIVPAAVIFDLGVGSAKVRPGKREGYLACADAKEDALCRGRIGAGTGATVAKAMGMEHAVPSGIGTAYMELEDGIKIAALAVVNAFGDIYDHHTGKALAASCGDETKKPPLESLKFTNTTIGVIATNAILTREEANKLAAVAHDGLALAIRPVHTSLDGDTFFALSTGKVETKSFLSLLCVAAEVVANAIEDAVR